MRVKVVFDAVLMVMVEILQWEIMGVDMVREVDLFNSQIVLQARLMIVFMYIREYLPIS
jgi:hypothetical protein